MVSKRLSLVWVAILSLSVSLAVAAKDEGLIGSIEAFRVITNEDGKENFQPAEKARPTDVIEYRLTYKNNGEEPVRNIFITDPIPSGTAYIELSASQPAQGVVEFSIDGGKTYHHWPIEIVERVKDGQKETTQATPEMVTHIRWTMTETFTPDNEITVSYRTIIK